jgi:hypothetical protein
LLPYIIVFNNSIATTGNMGVRFFKGRLLGDWKDWRNWNYWRYWRDWRGKVGVGFEKWGNYDYLCM